MNNEKIKAFEFAERLHTLWHHHSLDENGSCTINTALLDNLGEEKYKLFCRAFRRAHKTPPPDALTNPFFSEAFIMDRRCDQNCVTDHDIRKYWTDLSAVTEIVKKFI